MDYHYIVAQDNSIIGVYGSALRELAFERAAYHRSKGIHCEVFTKSGKKLHCGEQFKRLKGE